MGNKYRKTFIVVLRVTVDTSEVDVEGLDRAEATAVRAEEARSDIERYCEELQEANDNYLTVDSYEIRDTQGAR